MDAEPLYVLSGRSGFIDVPERVADTENGVSFFGLTDIVPRSSRQFRIRSADRRRRITLADVLVGGWKHGRCAILVAGCSVLAVVLHTERLSLPSKSSHP